MLKVRKSILGAALLAGLAATAAAPAKPASARPVWGPHGHWIHGWHDGRFGWWWTGPGYWYAYPEPIYYDYGPPPPDYVGLPAQPTWYYCDSAKAYFPYVGACPAGWRAVPAMHAPGSSPPNQASAPASQPAVNNKS